MTKRLTRRSSGTRPEAGEPLNFTLEANMNILRVLLFVLPCNAALAACPTNLYGSSKEFDVTIYQDCGIRSEIVATKRQNVRKNHEYQHAFFDTECKFSDDEAIFSCRNNGRTILSGYTYKMTHDGAPECKGDMAPSDRYTCIKGCNKGAPKHLDIEPYEGGNCDAP